MKPISKRLLALALAFLLTLTSFAVFAESAAKEEAPGEEIQEETGTANPFADMKLTNLDGTPFDTSVFIGKPIFLNIWATWCPPCVGEMPHLNELAAEYADKINIIGLHSEGLTVTEAGELIANEETNTLAVQLQADMNLTYPLVNPDNLLFILMNDPQYGLNVSVLPTTWLIDGEGYIRNIITAANDKEGWAQVIDDFLMTLQEEEDAKNGG